MGHPTALAVSPHTETALSQQSWEYIANFLSREEADELLAVLREQQPKEAGDKTRVSYGPQIYPIKQKEEKNSNLQWFTKAQGQKPEPPLLTALRARLTEKYAVPFNSIQCNFHEGSSEVGEHLDPHGTICMLRVGFPREFSVAPHKNRGQKTGIILEHGSLLTFLTSTYHSMKPNPIAGSCVSVIFRLVTEPLTQDLPSNVRFPAGAKEYDRLVKAFRSPKRQLLLPNAQSLDISNPPQGEAEASVSAAVNIAELSPEPRAQVCPISTPCTDGPLSLNEPVGQAAVMSTSIVPIEQSSQLAKLEAAHQALAECRTLPEVLKIQDLAEAARVYARKAHLGRESQNYAAEIALLAACKAGEILKQLERDTPQQSGAKKGAASVAAPSEYAQTIQDTATPERTARYWQELGSVPEEKRTEYINSVRQAECGEITSSGLLKACRSAKPKSERTMPAASPDHTPAAAINEALNFINSLIGPMSWMDIVYFYLNVMKELGHRLKEMLGKKRFV